jgi:Tol biopolymer transport system component
MIPERWQEIEKLYHVVSELPPDEREQHLSAADETVRSEVESLLRTSGSLAFLDRVAIDVAAQQFVSVEATDLMGRKLGRYHVLSRLGAGGMGVVYRARDTRLNRDVALKVLPAASIADAVRKRRFVQEARAASALNHPHIVSIYDIDQIDGIDFIAMECVPGKTLVEMIGSKGLPAKEAFAYGIQIAGALSAAHAAGIIHRDLKPGNVMVTGDGQVKVLDFGLAKLVEPPEGGSSTGSAWIAGTPAYMSPEQAEAKKVDTRSDIFSFGAVLYEMLTGQPAFGRESMSATVAAILRDEPGPVPELVPGLNGLLGHCLQKDPDRRYHAMADVKIALENLAQHPAFAATKRRERALLGVAAVALMAAAAGGTWLLVKPKTAAAPPPVTQLTFDGRLAMNPSISADGKYVAYASDRAGEGNLDIWLKALPAGEPIRLTTDEANEDYPSFSPDGTKIAFRSERDGGGIYVVPVRGGEPRLVAKNATKPLYSPDGKHLLFSTPKGVDLFEAGVMPAEGGEPYKFREADTFHSPVWSPDSNKILAVAGKTPGSLPTTWFVLPLGGGAPILSHKRDSRADTPLVWLPDNRVIFSSSTGLWASLDDVVNLWTAKLSPGDWKLTEPLEPLTYGGGRITSASVSSGGTVVFSSTVAPTRLWSFSLPKEGQPSEGDMLAIPSGGGLDYSPSLSLTGKMAYVSRKAGKWSLWARDLKDGRERWLAGIEADTTYAVSAIINSQGSRVAYNSCPGNHCAIYMVSVSGGAPQKICDGCGELRAWSRDGSMMASQDDDGSGAAPQSHMWFGINRIDPLTGSKTVLVQKNGFGVFVPNLSPDGEWIAFQACPTDLCLDGFKAEQLFVAPTNGPLSVSPDRWIAITGLDHFDSQPVWSHDGNLLYFLSFRDGSNCLWAVRLDAATKKPIGEPYAVRHFHANPRQYSEAVWPTFAIGEDRIVISLEQVQSDLWMMQLPPD